MNAVAPVIIQPAEHDRRRYIGGSDIAAVMGLSPWKTVVDVWEAKTAAEKPTERKKKVFHRGQRWEAVVAEMLTTELQAQGHKVEIIGSNRRFEDAEHPMFAAEIDYEIRLDDEPDITNVELKTVHPFKAGEWGESESDEIPIWYTAQGMWGLGVAPGQRKRCIVAPLFGADELRTYTVLRDDETLAAMRNHALVFWQNYVVPRVAPPPVNLADLQKLFPEDIRPFITATPEIHEAWLRLRAIKAEIGAREAEWEVLEFQVKQFMRDAGELVLPDQDKPVISWKPRPFVTLDQQGLKEAHPAIHKQFTRKSVNRTFIVK